MIIGCSTTRLIKKNKYITELKANFYSLSFFILCFKFPSGKLQIIRKALKRKLHKNNKNFFSRGWDECKCLNKYEVEIPKTPKTKNKCDAIKFCLTHDKEKICSICIFIDFHLMLLFVNLCVYGKCHYKN